MVSAASLQKQFPAGAAVFHGRVGRQEGREGSQVCSGQARQEPGVRPGLSYAGAVSSAESFGVPNVGKQVLVLCHFLGSSEEAVGWREMFEWLWVVTPFAMFAHSTIWGDIFAC